MGGAGILGGGPGGPAHSEPTPRRTPSRLHQAFATLRIENKNAFRNATLLRRRADHARLRLLLLLFAGTQHAAHRRNHGAASVRLRGRRRAVSRPAHHRGSRACKRRQIEQARRQGNRR